MKSLNILAIASVAALTATAATARDEIRIVGSSTVFPFSTVVAEQFGKKTDFATPVVESTGSGGGIKLFCAGVGAEHPDIANSSRRMKMSEYEMCRDNGVKDVIEVKIGFDGIVIGNAIDAPSFDLTRQDLYRALAGDVAQYGRMAPNAFGTWDQVSPALPVQPIEVLGPPPTSGTRDAFEELAIQKGAMKAGVEKGDVKNVTIRTDGAYIESGENDNLIVSKLEADPAKLGVFGFSFLDQNADRIKGARIEGVEPTFDNIASGEYPVSRSLWFYVKKAHIDVIPGIEEYMAEFLDDAAIGEDGYAVEKGLIPLDDSERGLFSAAVYNQVVMTGKEGLK